MLRWYVAAKVINWVEVRTKSRLQLHSRNLVPSSPWLLQKRATAFKKPSVSFPLSTVHVKVFRTETKFSERCFLRLFSHSGISLPPPSPASFTSSICTLQRNGKSSEAFGAALINWGYRWGEQLEPIRVVGKQLCLFWLFEAHRCSVRCHLEFILARNCCLASKLYVVTKRHENLDGVDCLSVNTKSRSSNSWRQIESIWL